ncbi:carbohydrate kinase family protein [Natrarchaeobius halalkaliphilus]|uniref:Carbohydrate kinase family protein n=1 Tax=Natrarchaeobius halalkaliphilus TaxID=1679091 RepID=A0A3N6P6H7_9EURY|nr:PfkB family carbohydrate kinase [Natrarchaeobius halalkaliphilus]RQG91395.1 carbohydrate kinase family protein [Natrarchaeobius halalkaliphilus]
MVRVVTAGHINWDVTLRVDSFPVADGEAVIRSQRQSGGGSAGNVAASLAGFGIETGLIGSVGDDDNGLLARQELEDAGVSLDRVCVVDGADTAVKYLLVDDEGEVAILGNDGVNEAIGPDDVDESGIRTAEHVHITGQRPETAAAIATAAHESDTTVSVDPGRRIADRNFTRTLEVADIVFANDRESAVLLEDHFGQSIGIDRFVVVKHGEDGAVVHAPNGSYTHAGFDVDPVDTAGAGDAFAAGFIARLLEGDDVERALEYGNACGALTASAHGARNAPSTEEISAFLGSRF